MKLNSNPRFTLLVNWPDQINTKPDELETLSSQEENMMGVVVLVLVFANQNGKGEDCGGSQIIPLRKQLRKLESQSPFIQSRPKSKSE